MNTGKESRSEEEIALKVDAACEIFNEKGEGVSDDEGRIDAVPNKLCLMGQPSPEEESEVSEKLFLAKIKSLDQKKCVNLIIKLWNEREDFVIELDKKDDIFSTLVEENRGWSNQFNELKNKSYSAALCKKCPMLETRIREVTGRNQELSVTLKELENGKAISGDEGSSSDEIGIRKIG